MKIPVPASVVRTVGGPIVRALAHSWQFRLHHAERWHRLQTSGIPYIYLLWHEALLPLLWHHRAQGIAIVVSEAREGGYLGDFATRIGYRLLPGSSTRGGLRALRGAVRVLHDNVPVAFTPDGPRGPRREVKPGIVRAAQRVGAQILPLHAEVDRAWRLRSWDRMVIPKPGASVRVGYGEPFAVDPGPDGLARGIARCESALISLESELHA
ncbi:MAG: lysophospholipid acyltransferase family protein [Gemmatimonadales bacterium]